MSARKEFVIGSVSKTGELIFVHNNPLCKSLFSHGTTTTRRASHVEPINLVYRCMFHLIRSCVSDDSRAAQWTRGWKCTWRANLALSNGPILQPFVKRQDAIDAEIEWLHNNNFGRN